MRTTKRPLIGAVSMSDAGTVMTVCGPVAPSSLGITHSHEHVMWDYWRMIRTYDVIFDDETVAADEVRWFAEAGGGALVDCTCTGLGPDPTRSAGSPQRLASRSSSAAAGTASRCTCRMSTRRPLPNSATSWSPT